MIARPYSSESAPKRPFVRPRSPDGAPDPFAVLRTAFPGVDFVDETDVLPYATWVDGPSFARVAAALDAAGAVLDLTQHTSLSRVEAVGDAVYGQLGFPYAVRQRGTSWGEPVAYLEVAREFQDCMLGGRSLMEWEWALHDEDVWSAPATPPLPTPTQDDVASWLSSPSEMFRRAGLRLAARLPTAPRTVGPGVTP